MIESPKFAFVLAVRTSFFHVSFRFNFRRIVLSQIREKREGNFQKIPNPTQLMSKVSPIRKPKLY